MSAPSIDDMTATSIPNITKLRTQLDYGDRSKARCQAFYDDLRVFLRKSIAADGTPAIDWYEWNTQKSRVVFRELAEAYLDESGLNFWPTAVSHPNKNRLDYAEDQVTITRLMTQLVFRLNQQRFRNGKYKRGKSQSHQAACRGNIKRARRFRAASIPAFLDQFAHPDAEERSLNRTSSRNPDEAPDGEIAPHLTRDISSADQTHVNIVYHILLSRKPLYHSQDWHPSLSLQDMSLAQLLKGIPFEGDIKSFHFIFSGPGVLIKGCMEDRDEGRFSVLKSRVRKGICAAIDMAAASVGSLTFEFEIEPSLRDVVMECHGET